jgi:hypothetical protein
MHSFELFFEYCREVSGPAYQHRHSHGARDPVESLFFLWTIEGSETNRVTSLPVAMG